jgi:arginase family enzyme
MPREMDKPTVSLNCGVDPGLAPGTGTPEAGGWTTREVKRILRGLAGLNFIGADIVEVAPAYDHGGHQYPQQAFRR